MPAALKGMCYQRIDREWTFGSHGAENLKNTWFPMQIRVKICKVCQVI